jgi:hypothetical protein
MNLIERAKQAMEGATPGPWELDGLAIAHPLPPHGYPVDVCLMGEPSQYPGDIPVMMQGWEANARLIALSPDLARLAVAAGELADLLDKPDQSDGKLGRYHYDWHKVDAALARFRAIAEVKE